jgi:hypothetical protein
MRFDTDGYYEIFGFDHRTCGYDKWLGTATKAAALAIGAEIGRFMGYDRVTPDGWACKAPR